MDPGRRNAGLDQRVTNDADPTLAEALVVAVGAERIRVAVEADVDRRILLRVVRDLGDLDHLVCRLLLEKKNGEADQPLHHPFRLGVRLPYTSRSRIGYSPL